MSRAALFAITFICLRLCPHMRGPRHLLPTRLKDAKATMTALLRHPHLRLPPSKSIRIMEKKDGKHRIGHSHKEPVKRSQPNNTPERPVMSRSRRSGHPGTGNSPWIPRYLHLRADPSDKLDQSLDQTTMEVFRISLGILEHC